MKKVLVYGSCVSRDLVSMNPEELTCLDYVARQSWISAGTATISVDIRSSLPSAFQNRMLQGDIKSTAIEVLKQKSGDSDFILLDLVDDRFGVRECNGGYITPSAEFQSSGAGTQLSVGKLIAFGTDEHFLLWKSAAQIIVANLGPVLGKTFVLQAKFANQTIEGTPVPPARGRDAESWNTDYDRYYRFLRELGFAVLELPDDLALSTSAHQWGAAPFHYISDAYSWWFSKIQEQLV